MTDENDKIILDYSSREMRYVNGHIRGWKPAATSFQSLIDYDSFSTEENILPPGCKHFQRSGDYAGFVIEEKPTIRSVRWQITTFGTSRRKEGDYSNVRLAMPYVVHYLLFCREQFQGSWVFFNNEPLTDINQNLGRAALQNCERSGKMCLGVNCNEIHPKHPKNLHPDSISQEQRIARYRSARIKYYFSTFWGTSFNFDMPSPSFAELLVNKDLPFEGVLDWAAKTEANPDFILQHKWKSADNTLADLMNAHLRINTDFGTLYRYVVNNGKRDAPDEPKPDKLGTGENATNAVAEFVEKLKVVINAPLTMRTIDGIEIQS